MPWARRVARAVTGAVVGLSLVLAGAALSLRFSQVRGLVTAKINRVLASTFVGSVTVDGIGALGLTHVEGIDAHVADASGRTLLRIEGARARVSTWTLVRSWMAGHGEVAVDIPELACARAYVTLDPDERGALRIARALELRTDRPRGETPGRGVRVSLSRISLEHATIHVQPNAAPPLDAEVDGAEARLRFAGHSLAIDLDRAPVVVRGLPGGVQARGQVEAHLTQPSLHVRALWRGAVGTIAD